MNSTPKGLIESTQGQNTEWNDMLLSVHKKRLPQNLRFISRIHNHNHTIDFKFHIKPLEFQKKIENLLNELKNYIYRLCKSLVY